MYSVEKQEIVSQLKNIPWNQLFSNLFNKTVAFTKFLSQKSIPVISTLCKTEKYVKLNIATWFDGK